MPVALCSVQVGGLGVLQGVQALLAGGSLLLGLAESLLLACTVSQLGPHGAQGCLAGPHLPVKQQVAQLRSGCKFALKEHVKMIKYM